MRDNGLRFWQRGGCIDDREIKANDNRYPASVETIYSSRVVGRSGCYIMLMSEMFSVDAP